MKIFISWSGDRSQALAKAINDWLKPLLHFAEPWLSTEDIKSGDRWGNELAKQLQDTNFGILCVTSDNLNAPWLLFEAGALAKSIDDGRVIPLLLDLEKSDLSGPLTQFQAEKSDKDGIKKLAESLNKAATTQLPADNLSTLIEALWPKLEEKITQIPGTSSPQRRIRPQAEVLEELVAGVRSVEMRVRDVLEDGPELRMRRRRRFHPELFMNLRHRMADGPNDPIQILVGASLFREEVPWFYEIALETYRAIRSEDKAQARPAIRRYKDALDLLRRGPFLEMIGSDSKLMHMMMMDMLEFMPFVDDTDIDTHISPSARSKRKGLPGVE